MCWHLSTVIKVFSHTPSMHIGRIWHSWLLLFSNWLTMFLRVLPMCSTGLLVGVVFTNWISIGCRIFIQRLISMLTVITVIWYNVDNIFFKAQASSADSRKMTDSLATLGFKFFQMALLCAVVQESSTEINFKLNSGLQLFQTNLTIKSKQAVQLDKWQIPKQYLHIHTFFQMALPWTKVQESTNRLILSFFFLRWSFFQTYFFISQWIPSKGCNFYKNDALGYKILLGYKLFQMACSCIIMSQENKK